MTFDIVIPLGPNEISKFQTQIQYTKKHVIGFRNIYIITCNTDIEIENCIIIDENIFPFKEFIKDYFHQHNGKNNRNGWYFQQLIKLYAGVYIENIHENYLVIDADVFFLKPTQFMEDEKCIFSVGNEYHIPYFTHMQLLHDSFKKTYLESGICHHMLFNKKYINEIFNIVETFHGNCNPFWKLFILSVNEHKNYDILYVESGASEYELYFNYMLINHRDNIIIRKLDWDNISNEQFENKSYGLTRDFVSVCSWKNT
jgi:hypothetical protein